ncbi:MAG TPA: hypothetical protein VMU78_05480 [Methylocella sp.]|nr:hypothetical protein [Methylocella sp.]
MTTIVDQAEFDHVESLLPWYASGKLAPEDIFRVERALAQMPELRRRYDLILEEREAAVAMNESLGAPSPQALEKLLARIDGMAAAPKSKSFDVGRWLAERFSNWQPRSLAFAGTAVAFLAMIEAGLLATLYFGSAKDGATYQTASASKPATGQVGTFVLIAFVPDATAAQILHFLDAHKASIVEGPIAGGIFRVQVCKKALTTKDRDAIVASMRNESTIVRFVAPTL